VIDQPAGGRTRWSALDRLQIDLGLYGLSAAFAGITAAYSTLAPHRAWGAIAAIGYAVAALAVVSQLVVRRVVPARGWYGSPGRWAVLAWAAAATVVVPLVQQAVQRAAGRTGRAQEEVIVVEQGGERLLNHGTPYLGHDALAALPPAEQLLGYLPYQPGMAFFGLPRALAGAAWWTDARIWFVLATAGALVLAVLVLPAFDEKPARLLPAVQAATVFPVCALTLATGGDDLPVLALCLLALALAAAGRYGCAGIAVGVAAALKLFAWPVLVVLLVHATVHGRAAAVRFAGGAVGLPLAAVLPVAVLDAPAVVENVIRFPMGHGLVGSPAQSPLPGHLIATGLPAGRPIAIALLLLAGLLIAVRLIRRPPRTAASAALVSGYGLLTAILLMPTTRFGYLLYPIALLAWWPVLARASGKVAADPLVDATGPPRPPAPRRPGPHRVPSHHADDLS
jgi:Glycosyltransferase family 87